MKQTISKSDFVDAFRVADRKENFSHEARELLFDYFEELENAIGEEMELDVIAVCCEYEENTVDEIIDMYSIDCSDIDETDNGEKHDLVESYLNYNTSIVGETANGFVYAIF